MKKEIYIKKVLKVTAIMAVLALCVVACKKQDDFTRQNEGVVGDNKERVIIYTVNHNENKRTLITEAEWDALLDQLCDQAQLGNEVEFFNMSPVNCFTGKKSVDAKSPLTLSTTNRDELKAWMKEMEEQGRTVKITYDDTTGTWNGVAYSTIAYIVTDNNIIGTWHFNYMMVNQIAPDGHLLEGDSYAPEEEGGSMYYTFHINGYMLLTFNSMDGIVATDSTDWTLSDEGKLCSELLPNGGCWDVNWITSSTMIISRVGLNDDNDNCYYQLLFDRQRKKISQL